MPLDNPYKIAYHPSFHFIFHFLLNLILHYTPTLPQCNTILPIWDSLRRLGTPRRRRGKVQTGQLRLSLLGGKALGARQNLRQGLAAKSYTPSLQMGGCQYHGPFLDPSYNTAPHIEGTQKRDHNFDNHSNGKCTFENAGIRFSIPICLHTYRGRSFCEYAHVYAYA